MACARRPDRNAKKSQFGGAIRPPEGQMVELDTQGGAANETTPI
jgi:hypothetical protein